MIHPKNLRMNYTLLKPERQTQKAQQSITKKDSKIRTNTYLPKPQRWSFWRQNVALPEDQLRRSRSPPRIHQGAPQSYCS